jgi:hypothetical protein
VTVKNITLNQQTTVAMHLIIEDDTGVLAFSILVATKLFAYFWHLIKWAVMTKNEMSLLFTDFKASLDFTA